MAFEGGKSYNLTASANTSVAEYMAAIYTHVNGSSTLWTVAQETETLRAVGSITVLAGAVGTTGDVITIGGATLTGVSGTPGANQYDATTPATINALAAEIRRAINDSGNSINAQATARLPATPGALIEVDSVAPGVAGNSKNLLESTSGVRYTVSGATLTGGAASPGNGSFMMILEPVLGAADFQILLLNKGTQDTPDTNICYVAINPDQTSDPWDNGEEPILGGGAANSSGITLVNTYHGAECMDAATGGSLNTEFVWLEYPDALTWLTKDADRLYMPRGFHAGQIFTPDFVDDISSPATGQALDGLGVLGTQPAMSTSTQNTYWLSVPGNAVRNLRIRCGTGDGDTAANVSDVRPQGVAWMAEMRPLFMPAAANIVQFQVGANSEARPWAIELTTTTELIPFGKMNYLKLFFEGRPFTKHQVSGTDRLMTLGITDGNYTLCAHIENGFDPRP